jgi:pilus assembly protein CpaE
MPPSATTRQTALSGILVAPDRALAARFSQAMADLDAFQILLDLKSYPSEQTLDIRTRQLQPEVVFVDVSSSLDKSVEIISQLARMDRPVTAVAVDNRSDSDTILRVLRAGASEFLYAPFEPAATSEALARLVQLRKPERAAPAELGSVCVFSSVKPGSGASTLATHTAFALRRTTGKRVLLADFDLVGGTVGFYLKLNHASSTLDALEGAARLNAPLWTSLVAAVGDLDILSAPIVPQADAIDTGRLQTVLDYARTMYEWVVIDLPVVFQRTSLMVLPQADRTFLVSTSELPSLHLARKSILMLEQLGLPKDRFQMIVNRLNKHDGISRADIERLFGTPVFATFPNDYFSLHRVVTFGQPLSLDTDLGRAVEGLAEQLSAAPAAVKTPTAAEVR